MKYAHNIYIHMYMQVTWNEMVINLAIRNIFLTTTDYEVPLIMIIKHARSKRKIPFEFSVKSCALESIENI